jgi:hypothetical protein
VFQIALLLTFEDDTTDECLENIMGNLGGLADMAREHHQELLLASWAVQDRDVMERCRRVVPHDPDPGVRQRAKDILMLAKAERLEREGASGD